MKIGTTISTKKALALIEKNGHKIFGSKFVKRGDGSVRSGSFRIGVRKNIQGNPRYNPKDHSILRVYDMKSGYRSIPLEGILSVTLNGSVYTVK